MGQTEICRNPAPLPRRTSIPVTAGHPAIVLERTDWPSPSWVGGSVPEQKTGLIHYFQLLIDED